MKFYFLIIFLSILIFSETSCQKEDLSNLFVGEWIGEVEVSIRDVNGKLNEINTPMKLIIDSDMNINGIIGDAIIENCRLKSNKANIGNWLNIKTDYIIYSGFITGKIDPLDVTEEREFTLPYNLVDDKISGTVMIIYNWKNPESFCEVELIKKI